MLHGNGNHSTRPRYQTRLEGVPRRPEAAPVAAATPTMFLFTGGLAAGFVSYRIRITLVDA